MAKCLTEGCETKLNVSFLPDLCLECYLKWEQPEEFDINK